MSAIEELQLLEESPTLFKKLSVKSLALSNYRNYAHKTLELNPDKSIILIEGPNGSGKTNILEAISMLNTSKGLRSANNEEITRINSEKDFWHIEALIDSTCGIARIIIHYDSMEAKTAYFNGNKASQAELARLFNIVYLTPQMGNLFIEAASQRRKYFDKVISSFIPSFQALLHKYEHYQKERLSILKTNLNPDATWLDIIESNLVEAAKEIYWHRKSIIDDISNALNLIDSSLPIANIKMKGEIEEIFATHLNPETELKLKYKEYRQADSLTGKNNFGIFKTDFAVYYMEKNMPASMCSTGEQKSLLTSLIIAETIAKIKRLRHIPVLLLDEINTHLDHNNRKQLLSILESLGAQIFLTCTDANDYSWILEKSERIKL